MRVFICCLLAVAFLTACSKNEEQKPASTPPVTPPPALLVTNSPPAPESTVSVVPVVSKKIERTIEVKGAGNLRIRFPATWDDRITRIPQKGRMIDSIVFLPHTNDDFQLMVDVNNVGQTNADLLDARGILQKTGQAGLTNSMEKALDIHDFQGTGITGGYFVLTDKGRFGQPAQKGDYLYLTEGFAKIDGLVISFHLVCNRLSPFQDDLLEMMKTMRLDKK